MTVVSDVVRKLESVPLPSRPFAGRQCMSNPFLRGSTYLCLKPRLGAKHSGVTGSPDKTRQDKNEIEGAKKSKATAAL